jgi:hypothetical protein
MTKKRVVEPKMIASGELVISPHDPAVKSIPPAIAVVDEVAKPKPEVLQPIAMEYPYHK